MHMQQRAATEVRRMAYLPMAITVLAALVFVTGPAVADPPVGYYDSVDDSSAANLRATLHEVIDDHTRYPYTSTATDTWDILEQADEDPNNASNILDVYKNASYPKFGAGNNYYQREHTWPSSYGFPNDNSQNYPYTDCHHLMLCDGDYNASRSNKPYRTCSAACNENPTDVNNGAGGGTGVYPGNSNWTEGSFTTGTWETWIGRRGDVARTMFYMDIRYEGGTHGGTGAAEPDLILTDSESLIDSSNTGSNESIAYMGMLTVLLQWHAKDPVDDDERARNDVVYGYQLNRNPFVDHPEWVNCIYNDVCGTPQCIDNPDCDDGLYCNGAETCVAGSCQPGTDPCPGQDCDEVNDVCIPLATNPWINEFHYDNDSTDTGEFVEIAGPAGIDLSGWSVVGYNGNGGGVYDTVNLSGTIPDQQGCMGTLAFTFTGMQNGSPDGLALVDDLGTVIEFISYEGVITATDGPANGMTSVDIGVFEPTDTPVGQSLQLAGTGAQASDFTWQSPATNTEGLPNNSQTFDGCDGCTSDPECDDGIYCNGAETCVAGACQPGTAVNCDDGVACTDDSCNETTDSCDNVANDANCDDGLYCNGAETCDALLDCQAGTDPCPGQSCDEATDTCVPTSSDPWINEFHYDNDSTDTGEFVEVAGPAGTNLSGWSVVGYNGNGGGVYDTVNLSGTIPDQQGCMGTLAFAFTGMQNGSPDGLALVDDLGTVIEFISYEGVITATDGPANGMTSVDIGVFEPSDTPVGLSLQLAGTGAQSSDFSWQSPATNTAGLPNNSQTFDGCGGCTGDAECDDGLFCNGAETCVAGSCQPGTAVDCNDGVACTDDSCNESTDACDNVANDANCNNGLFCDGAETCDALLGCQAGTAVDCSDGVACTDDSCNETTDSCDNLVNDANCDNGLYCDGAETCDALLGCQAGSAVNCDDGVVCTTDACNESTDACDNTPDDGACDDGLFCNGAEWCDALLGCQAGSDPCPGQTCDETGDVCVDCTGDLDCDDGLYCNGAETCVSGSCQPGTAVDCSDGVACTDDSCNETTESCDNVANDANCDDGLYCNGAESCDALLGCQAGTTVNCDDGVACTDDSCNETTGACDNIANDANCNDGLYCNGAETCDPALDCQAGTDPCVGQLCDEVGDVCVDCFDDLDCDDGLYCNGAETCVSGSCQTGTAVDCNDGVACTDDSCNETTDSCDNVVNDANCDDGLHCNGAETCDALLGCQAGVAVHCDDGVPCTDDSCNESTDACDNVANDANCDDGLYCNGAEWCDALLGCQTGTAINCSDGVGCTDDYCNETTDSCDNIANDANCPDNGLFCDGTEYCDAINDCSSTGDPCGVGETCNETTDVCESSCVPSGGSCTQNSDCCSNKCLGWGFCK